MLLCVFDDQTQIQDLVRQRDAMSNQLQARHGHSQMVRVKKCTLCANQSCRSTGQFSDIVVWFLFCLRQPQQFFVDEVGDEGDQWTMGAELAASAATGFTADGKILIEQFQDESKHEQLAQAVEQAATIMGEDAKAEDLQRLPHSMLLGLAKAYAAAPSAGPSAAPSAAAAAAAPSAAAADDQPPAIHICGFSDTFVKDWETKLANARGKSVWLNAVQWLNKFHQTHVSFTPAECTLLVRQDVLFSRLLIALLYLCDCGHALNHRGSMARRSLPSRPTQIERGFCSINRFAPACTQHMHQHMHHARAPQLNLPATLTYLILLTVA